MAVRFVREDTANRIANKNDRGERIYVRTFTVEVDDATDGGEVVLEGDGVPRRWEPYRPASGENDEGSICQDVKATPRQNSRTVWDVVAYYTNHSEPTQIEDPLQRPSKVSVVGSEVSVPIIRDIYGQPLLNTARDPFDPAPEDAQSRKTIKVVKNYLVYPIEEFMDLENTVNANPFALAGVIWKRRHVKFRRSSAEELWENGMWFWQVTMEFEIKKEIIPDTTLCTVRMYGENGELLVEPEINDEISYAWTRFLLNRGFREIKDGVKVIARDKRYFQTFSAAPFLDVNGAQLEFNGKPVYLGFDTLPEGDFSILDLEP